MNSDSVDGSSQTNSSYQFTNSKMFEIPKIKQEIYDEEVDFEPEFKKEVEDEVEDKQEYSQDSWSAKVI